MPVVSDDPLGNARSESVGVFCVLAYVFLQTSCARQQRYHPQTRRARVYFWLLALFPLWSLPVALVLPAIITQVGFFIARNT